VAKTADVLQAIWADPWFVALPPDGKLIFLWAITNSHSNLAGVYVVAEETIRHETKLSTSRLTKAFGDVHPKMGYRPETGTVCVPSRPKYVRSRTTQIAKSIAFAIRDCLHPEIRDFYLRKYGSSEWLSPAFEELALRAESVEPHQGSPNLSEVPSQSQSQKKKEQQNPRDAEWADWLAHFQEVTGKTATTGSATARRNFNARRAEGRSLASLKQATVGCHGDAHLREQGFNRPETILGDSKVERYIELGKRTKSGAKTDPALARIAARPA
jgi:hypothetical protein